MIRQATLHDIDAICDGLGRCMVAQPQNDKATITVPVPFARLSRVKG